MWHKQSQLFVTLNLSLSGIYTLPSLKLLQHTEYRFKPYVK